MSRLHRHIGLLPLVLYGVGDILGSGIYGLVGKVAGQLGNMLWLAFAVSLAIALFTGLTYAALGSRYPRAAGSSYIAWRAFRSPLLAFVVGLATLGSGLTSMAAASRIFGGYFTGLIPTIPMPVAVIGFCLLLFGIVFAGIRESLWVNAVCTIIELTGLLIVVMAALPYLGQVNLLDIQSIPSGEPLTISLVLGSSVLAFYSFIGFEDMINVSEEVKNPQRNIPLGLMLALLIASTIYMLISVLAVSVVPAAQLNQSKQPLVDVVRVAWPWFPSHVFSVIALFAVANTALLNFVMCSRLIYGLARMGLLPHGLSRVHGRTKTPHLSVITVVLILLGLAFVGDVASLARATSIFILLTFVVMCLSLWRVQRREPHGGHWRLPQWVPLVGAAGSALMLAHAQANDYTIAGLMMIPILLIYFIKRPTAEQIEKLESQLDT